MPDKQKKNYKEFYFFCANVKSDGRSVLRRVSVQCSAGPVDDKRAIEPLEDNSDNTLR